MEYIYENQFNTLDRKDEAILIYTMFYAYCNLNHNES